MSQASERVTVLLGAGASADAGLPLTSELAQMVVQAANDEDAKRRGLPPGAPSFVSALNAVYASMVGYQGQRGENPLTAVNIETLISAVRLLQDRENHEVAPFVAAWSAAVNRIPSDDVPSEPGRKIANAVARGMTGRHVTGSEIAKEVATIARAALQPDLVKPFTDAELFVLKSLVSILSDVKDVDYLKPLIELARTQRGGADVITLNYDLTVETAARSHSLEVARGIENWQPGAAIDLPPREGVLNLLKLHGSLDWRRERPGHGTSSFLAPPRLRVMDPHVMSEDRRVGDLPWIVVGDREKLATDGPTLSLHFAARMALLRSTHLAIVGYSFGDGHINSMVRDWLAADAARTVSILDTSWQRHRYSQAVSDFRSALLHEYGRDRDSTRRPLQPRVVAVEGTAGMSLDKVIRARPLPPPSAFVTGFAERSEENVKITLTWHGSDLARASITARTTFPGTTGFGNGEHVDLFTTSVLDEEPRWHPRADVGFIERGATISAYAKPTTALPLEVSIGGFTVAGSPSGTAVIYEGSD